jgi:hypothetical protein
MSHLYSLFVTLLIMQNGNKATGKSLPKKSEEERQG